MSLLRSAPAACSPRLSASCLEAAQRSAYTASFFCHAGSFHAGRRSCSRDSASQGNSQGPHALTRQLAQELSLPLFPASGKQLHLLQDPSHFYETLKRKIGQARSRIFLASLYIGKEEVELVQALEQALQRNPSLQLTILVDALRGTREAAPTPSCASLVSKLHAQFPDRVNIRLYHTPNLKGLLKKIVGKRFNEGWGLQHMKIYGFDDDVVLSGANLSRDYFTNRRDRYLLVEDHKDVADYLDSLVRVVGQFSFKLESSPQEAGSSAEAAQPDWKLVWDGGRDCLNPEGQELSAPYAETGWSREASKSLEAFTRDWQHRTADTIGGGSDAADTLLLPLLQMGPLQIRQETQAIPRLLEVGLQASEPEKQPATLALTSGYFSLYKPYRKLLLRTQATRTAIVKIICAAPEANGFFRSKGVSGWIPDGYTWYEYQFWTALKRAKRLLGQNNRPHDQGGVEILEWKKEGWTYHAKGIWLTPSDAASQTNLGKPASSDTAEVAAPTLVHVGSSNYGSRSADLDLECTFMISTSSTDLSLRFKDEFETLGRDANDVVNAELFQRPDRKVRWRVRVAAWILRRML